MHEILRNLQPGSRVLDLGCASGSFPAEATLADVVRLDQDVPRQLGKDARFVRANAASLPFADGTFDAIISNHSLEHFADLPGALCEIGRVIRPGGSLFVAVPDASTLTDRLYRWLAKGGGHLNAFTSPGETAAMIAGATGLTHVGTRTLCSSLSYLNRRNRHSRPPRRYLLLGAGYEPSLWLYVWVSRRLDRLFKTRLSIYGWAFYFGKLDEPVDTATWTNVCMRCGSGFPAAWLKELSQVRRRFLGVPVYRCAQCGATNPFSADHGTGVTEH
jgi:SAM-dependent methyltransferase